MRRATLNARRLGTIAIVVLALHGLLLRGVHDALAALDTAAPHRPPPGIQVRMVVLAVPLPNAEPNVAMRPTTAAQASSLARRGQGAAQRSAAPAAEPSRPAPAATALAPTPPAATTPPLAALPAQPMDDAAGLASADVAAPTPAGDLPIYRTVLPPAFAFGYDLRRGSSSGSGELKWRPQGERYESRFVGASEGVPLLAWESVGGFDAAGLAPARYTDRRRGRGAQAANFRRDAGKVTFSGPAVEHALPPGAQDRLSWMLQSRGHRGGRAGTRRAGRAGVVSGGRRPRRCRRVDLCPCRRGGLGAAARAAPDPAPAA